MTDERVPVDPFLRELVNVLLSLGSGIGFTFFLGDHVVCGSVITEEEYCHLTDELLFEAAGVGGCLPGCRTNPGKNRQVDEDEASFIHLRGVTIIMSSGREISSALLRVRMTDVLGWSLGAPALVPVA